LALLKGYVFPYIPLHFQTIETWGQQLVGMAKRLPRRIILKDYYFIIVFNIYLFI